LIGDPIIAHLGIFVFHKTHFSDRVIEKNKKSFREIHWTPHPTHEVSPEGIPMEAN
jgi:hypothetical protein